MTESFTLNICSFESLLYGKALCYAWLCGGHEDYHEEQIDRVCGVCCGKSHMMSLQQPDVSMSH